MSSLQNPESDRAYDREHPDARFYLSIAAIAGFNFVAVFTETMLNVMFPKLMSEFQIDAATVQWCTTSQILLIAAIIPLSVWINSRFTFRQIFLTGSALFLAGCAVAFWSPAFPVLVAARVVQGVAVGLNMPLTFNVIMEQAPYSRIGTFVGLGNLVVGLAPALGPVFGGIISMMMPWRDAFLIIAALILLFALMGAFSIRQTHAIDEAARVSVLQFVLCGLGFIVLIIGIQQLGITIEKQVAGEPLLPSLPVACGGLVAGLALMAGFAVAASHSRRPLINMRLFAYRDVVLIAFGCLFAQTIQLGFSFIVPNFGQLGLKATSMQAGFIVLPGALIGSAMTLLAGRLFDRHGPAATILPGILILAIALIFQTGWTWRLVAATLALVYAIAEAGYAFTFSNTFTLGLDALPESLRTDGNALLNAFQQFGCAAGTTVFATIFSVGQFLGRRGGLPAAAAATKGAQMASAGMLLSLVVLALLVVPVVIRHRNVGSEEDR